MRTRNLILLFFLILLIFFALSWPLFLYTRSLQNKVLNFLKENLEFCQISKSKVFLGKGEFWLICNGRPFYATYDDGKVNYELNGWGFLKNQPEILDELTNKECNFYKFNNNQLTFFCRDKKFRTYDFSISDFRLAKSKEDFIINYLLERPRYNLEILGDFEFEFGGDKFLVIYAKYDGADAKIALNLDKMYFTLPIVTDATLSNEEKVKKSFELINICKIDFVDFVEKFGPQEVMLGLDCNLGKPIISYNFELGLVNLLFKEREFEKLFPYFWKYNFLEMTDEELKYLKEEEKNGHILKYYLANERVIIALTKKNSGLISEVYFKNEGLK